MAKDPLEDLFLLAAVAGGAYLLWNWWGAQQVAPAPATGGGGTAPGVPPTPDNPGAYTPPTLTVQMQDSANSNSIIQAQGGQADAYQWATLWTGIGQPSIANVNGIFFPQGLPANAAAVTAAGGTPSQGGLPLMSLATFMAALKSAGLWNGLSGFGQAPTLVPVPVLIGKNRTILNLPRGTTPAMLQAKLRGWA